MKPILKRKSLLLYLLLSALIITGCRSDQNSKPEQTQPAEDANSAITENTDETDTDALINQILGSPPKDANAAQLPIITTAEPNTIAAEANSPKQTQTTIENEPNLIIEETVEQLKQKAKQRTTGDGTQWSPEQVEQLKQDLRNMTSQQRREYIKNFMKQQDNQENTN